jgi:hypothetical protein
VISGGRTPDDHAIGRDDPTIARERRVIEGDDRTIARDDPLIVISALSRLARTIQRPSPPAALSSEDPDRTAGDGGPGAGALTCRG